MITGNEPIMGYQDDAAGEIKGGLTIRQYFAGLAMQGYIASNPKAEDGSPEHIFVTAKKAVIAADALINELNVTKDTK